MTRTATRALMPALSGKDHVRGSPQATVTLVGYGDFAHPGCAATYRAVKAIQSKMGSRLRYVFRPFPQPVDCPQSDAAAEAAECASSQGKFWEMHDAMFENDGASDEFSLCRHARNAGLDMEKFRCDMRSHAYRAGIRAVRREALRSGVAQAPTFFINRQRHESAFGLATLLPAVQAAGGGA